MCIRNTKFLSTSHVFQTKQLTWNEGKNAEDTSEVLRYFQTATTPSCSSKFAKFIKNTKLTNIIPVQHWVIINVILNTLVTKQLKMRFVKYRTAIYQTVCSLLIFTKKTSCINYINNLGLLSRKNNDEVARVSGINGTTFLVVRPKGVVMLFPARDCTLFT